MTGMGLSDDNWQWSMHSVVNSDAFADALLEGEQEPGELILESRESFICRKKLVAEARSRKYSMKEKADSIETDSSDEDSSEFEEAIYKPRKFVRRSTIVPQAFPTNDLKRIVSEVVKEIPIEETKVEEVPQKPENSPSEQIFGMTRTESKSLYCGATWLKQKMSSTKIIPELEEEEHDEEKIQSNLENFNLYMRRMNRVKRPVESD